MAGRKVELIVEDSQGRPDVALTKLRKIVEHDRVHIVAGVLFGHIGYAMAPKVEEYRIPALFTVAASDDLTQRLKYRWVIRTGWASSQPSHPFGEYAAKTLGYRKVAVIASDYAFGWEVVGGFQRTFEENGGQVIPEALGPARRHGSLAVHREDPPGRRRGPDDDRRRLDAAVPQAVRGGGAEGQDPADRRRPGRRRGPPAGDGRRGPGRRHSAHLQRRARDPRQPR